MEFPGINSESQQKNIENLSGKPSSSGSITFPCLVKTPTPRHTTSNIHFVGHINNNLLNLSAAAVTMGNTQKRVAVFLTSTPSLQVDNNDHKKSDGSLVAVYLTAGILFSFSLLFLLITGGIYLYCISVKSNRLRSIHHTNEETQVHCQVHEPIYESVDNFPPPYDNSEPDQCTTMTLNPLYNKL